ncbi:MAG: hypothetical protein J0L75_10720 [Spirochaetes bacterium]|nr:hypothetical protein [Spirochaetota bacterium]
MKTNKIAVLVRFLLVLAWGALATAYAVATDPWIDRGYLYRMAITNLNPADPTKPLTDFPVVIAITNSYWLNAYYSDGSDITFAGVDGQQLFHEIEFYNRTSGKSTLQAWVCLPTFSNKTTIYIYWRNLNVPLVFAGSNSTQALSGNFASLITPSIYNNVWDTDFLSVHHFSEVSGLGRDSTVYGTHVTSVGTNIYSNVPGLWINTAGSQPRGYLSSNRLFATPAGYANVSGVSLSAFNNKPGTVPYDRFYSNGSITHSLWMRFQSYPSNANYFHPSTGTWVGSSNGLRTGLFTLNRAWGFPNGKDGYGGLLLQNTNGNHNAFHRQQQMTGASAFYLTNTNLGPVGGPYETWLKYDVTALHDLVANRVALQLYQNTLMIKSNYVTPSAETGSTLGGITLMGVTTEYLPDASYGATPNAYFDEYRLSAIQRPSNWVLNEYSNVVSTTNMAVFNGLSGDTQESLLYILVSNYNAFGSPVVGGSVTLGVDLATLVVPERPPQFVLTNTWILTNTNAAWGIVSNIIYTSDTNDYRVTFSGLPAGVCRAQILSTSSAADTGLSKPFFFVVGTEATYDLSRFSIKQTNTGFILDLFSGYDGGAARPTDTKFWRDNVQYTGMIPLGGNRYLDTNDLYYDETRTYRTWIQYSNVTYYSNYWGVAPGKKSVTNRISAAGADDARMLLNFEMAAQFPSGTLAADADYTLAFPTDQVGVDGYRQMVIDDGDGVYANFSQPVSLRLKVRIAGGYVTVPGTTKRVILSEASRLTLGYWDGLQWNALSTTVTPFADRVELKSAISREGRVALMFNDGSSAGVDAFRLRNRMLVPGSTDPSYCSMLFSWNKKVDEKATLSIYTQSGRLIFQRKDMLDPFWFWDGRGTDGTLAAPGVYLYAVIVGTKAYRGSLVVMGQ